VEFLKKIRDGLMGVEYESEEEDYEYVEDFDDGQRGHGSGDKMGYFTRFDRDEREEERPSKSKKKNRGFLSKEPARSKRSSRDYEQDYDYDYEAPRQSGSRRSSSDSKVLNLPTASSYHGGKPRIVLFSPETLEDARPVCEDLKNGVICVINLERLDKAVAQRIADFLGGACDALNGSIQRISHDIFLIAPENVAITSQVREELKNNGLILPWVQTAFRK